MKVAVGLLLLPALFPSLAHGQGREQAPWTPPAEPPAWAEVRRTLQAQPPPLGLARRRWIFIRALDRPDLRAGEYLADLTAASDPALRAVTFNGVALIQRPQQGSGWQIRERRMRALCAEGRFEVLDASGVWVAYDGQQDPAAEARLGWICSRGGWKFPPS